VKQGKGRKERRRSKRQEARARRELEQRLEGRLGTRLRKRAEKRAAKRLGAKLEKRVARRIAAVKAWERALAERLAALEGRERALVLRALEIDARERALAEREAIANDRDRLAAERDSVAIERDRTAAQREATLAARVAGVMTLHAPTAADDDRGAAMREVMEPDEVELERARLEAELQRAHLDGLTGAYRREVGRLALRNEIERARRGDGRFVIAFVDVDGLKGVNDRDGHSAGDRVLRTLAATLRANLRSYDPIVRYGGDEFVCGVASVDTSEVVHRIAVIDQSMRNATGVGITAGLATLSGNETLEELTERADAALLDAKRGRDR
jgi:diguanylate cyclase (GGDEF)-like protein